MKARTALSFFLLLLQNLGRPVFYLILAGLYLFLWLSAALGRFLFFLYRKTKEFLLDQRQQLKRLTLPQISFKLPHPYFPPLPRPKTILAFFLVFVFLLTVYFFYSLFLPLPNPDALVSRQIPQTTKIYDRNGELLYKIYRNQNRTLVKLNNIPLHLQQAVIAIEDAEFYQHHGFSLRGILRAIQKSLTARKIEGGSTITQQLVKNVLLSPEKTLKRKLEEIVLSILVEQKFSKAEILQMYLNEVNFGGSVYGVEEAAQTYFNKSVSDLDLAESAFLAGLPASPTIYSPFGTHPELAYERQTLVLNRMVQENFITQKQAMEAKNKTLSFAPQAKTIKAPHFVMYVKEQLVKKYGESLVEEGGLEVKTTLDLSRQIQAEKILNEELEKVKGLHIQNGGVLVTNPESGEILAMVGSKDYFDLKNQGNYNVTLAQRQPGSSIKPVNYAAALSLGFTPATIIPDTPITYHVPGQPPYSPQNYDRKFRGNVSLRTALGSSLNVPAVKVLSAIGVNRMIEQGKKMGITTWSDPSRFGLSLTLGGGEVKMVDMAVVYGTLANLGQKAELTSILEVKDAKGRILEKNDPKKEKEEVLDPKIAFLLNDILKDNEARTPVFGSHSLLVIPNHTVAVKTGTTNNLKDNWAIGYTPSFVVVVWVGNNDSSPMSRVTSGISGATPVWHRVMAELLKDKPEETWPIPEGIVRLEICPATGSLSCNLCKGKWEYFIKGTEPKTKCSDQ